MTGACLRGTAGSSRAFGSAFAFAFAFVFLASPGIGLRDGTGWLFQLVFTLRQSVISQSSLQ